MKSLYNFFSITLLFTILSVIAIFALKGFDLIFWLVVLTVLFLFIQFTGAYFIGLNFHLKSVNALNTKQKKVLLTFDDGPHLKNTPKVLSILQKHKVNGLFFLIGQHIKGNEMVVKQIIEQGNIIGNHSYTHHFWFDLWSTKKIITDIEACEQLIETFQIGRKLFRPPYGVTNPNISRALKKLHLTSIGWNIRSYDTSIKNVEKINARILSKLKPGAIILLHDRLDFMPDLLEKLIPAIKAEGYEFSIEV
ncbi:MAG: polysaccharide deacetylase family protein [Bacteroidota bacterium]